MSEENLPEDNNLNEEVGQELNDNLNAGQVEEAVTTNEDSGDDETPDNQEENTPNEESTPEEGTGIMAAALAAASAKAGETSAEANEDSVEETVEGEVEEESKPIEESTPAEETSVMDAALAASDVKTEEAESETVAEEPVKEKPVDDGKRWYSLRVISGKERKIKERIELEIKRNNWSSAVSQVLVPSEKVYKIRSGKKVILERNILPGYILIEAPYKKFSPEVVQGIANIPNVIHFLGKTKPIPMQQSEANRMLGKVDESQEVGEALIEPFIVGETVKIIDGPFNGFVGDIKEVNEEKKKLKVIVKIFGRGTEVELNFMQVDKES